MVSRKMARAACGMYEMVGGWTDGSDRDDVNGSGGGGGSVGSSTR